MSSVATQLRALQNLEMHSPHAFLGIHAIDEDWKVIRLWRPGAKEVNLEGEGKVVDSYRVADSGLFEYVGPAYVTTMVYSVFHHNVEGESVH